MIEVDGAALEQTIGHWADGGDPLNEQLAVGIGDAIGRGELTPGTRLPSERDLARQLGLSRTTVVAAYDRLRSAGLVRSRQGSGTRVTARTPRAEADADGAHAANEAARRSPGLFQSMLLAETASSAPRRTRQGSLHDTGLPGTSDLIQLTIGALPAPPDLLDMVEQSVREDLPQLLGDFGYLPYGLPTLREAIARHLSGLGLPTVADEVLVTSGAQQAVHLVSHELAGPHGVVAIEDPTYLGAVDALRVAGVRMLPIPLDRDGIALDPLRQTLGATSVDFVYLVPTFQNPTGSVLPAPSRTELVELATAHHTLIVQDLTPTLCADEGVPAPIGAPGGSDRVITIGSLSKGAWGGLRVGWVRATRPLIGRLAAARTVADHGSPVLSQLVAARVLADAERFDRRAEHESAVRRQVALEELRRLLPDWRVTPPRGGLSLWVRLPEGDASEFATVAAARGVIVRPGPVASPRDGFRDHLRIAVGEDPERLREGIRRLAAAWDAYQPRQRRYPSLAVSV
jgi:DNA-binding transcriptional MocR family regulator